MKFLPAIERRRIINMIMRFLKPNTKWMKIMILGRPFVVETNEWYQWSDDYEPMTTDYVRSRVQKGDIALDIGAHEGYYTLLFAELVGPRGKVFAFEPNPDVMKVLKFNVKSNGYKNVYFIHKAVSDSVGSIRFFIPESSNCASMRPMTSVRKVLEVNTTTIDTLKFDEVNFVKIDVEGAEYKVLRGMRKTISENPRAKFIVEFRPLVLREDAERILDMFSEYSVMGKDDNLIFERRISV